MGGCGRGRGRPSILVGKLKHKGVAFLVEKVKHNVQKPSLFKRDENVPCHVLKTVKKNVHW